MARINDTTRTLQAQAEQAGQRFDAAADVQTTLDRSASATPADRLAARRATRQALKEFRAATMAARAAARRQYWEAA